MSFARHTHIPADVLASLRANPVLASVSAEALQRIAEVVVHETRAQVGAALRDVDLFRGLSDEDFERIQEIADPVVVDADTLLFSEGDPGDRFYVVVRGAVELTRADDGGLERLAVLREGQAFGEMALLDDVPRPATARVTESSYLIGVTREAFLDTVGGDTMASRLLRNLSKVLRLTSVPPVHEESRAGDTPREALVEYNRMVRSRLLPRGMPSLTGYDLAGSTLAQDQGEGTAVWDWFLLSDGRLALAVLKADQTSLSSAHRLLAVRGLLRDFAQDPLPGVGALLTRVNRGLRSGWVDGISGTVSCGVVAVSDDGVEWASAGGAAGTVVRAGGGHQDLVPDRPALGATDDLEYRSARVPFGPDDHLVIFSEGPSDSVIVGRKFLTSNRRFATARERLAALIDRIRESGNGNAPPLEITAALVTRTTPQEAPPRSGADAIARAAAAFDEVPEEEV